MIASSGIAGNGRGSESSKLRTPGPDRTPTTGGVLVVEDDPDLQRELVELFDVQKISVMGVSNGQEALAKMIDWRPSVILVDLMMPLMNGWELVSRMRADPRLSSVTIFVMTAHGTRAAIKGIPVFHKPLNRDSLLRAVRACVGGN